MDQQCCANMQSAVTWPSITFKETNNHYFASTYFEPMRKEQAASFIVYTYKTIEGF